MLKKYILRLYLYSTFLLLYPFSYLKLKYKIFLDFSISNSQIFQDIIVLYFTKYKKAGYFIEVGAGDGYHLSNTYLLEKFYKWDGLLIEPSKNLYDDQKKFRSCKKINAAVYKKDTTKFYYEREDPYSGSISNELEYKKKHKIRFLKMSTIFKLKKIKQKIDYLSIDIEGNELDVLTTIDFKTHRVKFISIEHNFDRQKRLKIFNFLSKLGYIRILKKISYMDDYYILSS